jgi:hypothetical protein
MDNGTTSPSNTPNDNKAKADLSKYKLDTWDAPKIKKAAAGLERFAPVTASASHSFPALPW